MKKFICLLFFMLWALPSVAGVMEDFDGLGENKDLFDKAKALHPEMNVTVVQPRIVDRRNRLELAPEIDNLAGGDAYSKTYGYGLNAYYHITPHWSLGAKYTYYTNKFTNEAENLVNGGTPDGAPIVPSIDYPKNSLMGSIAFYPIYGKFNFLGMGITHFDVYATAGGGSIRLNSGSTGIWTGGVGVGFWWSQHLTTRLEARYQSYTAQRLDGPTKIQNTVFGLQVGYLL